MVVLLLPNVLSARWRCGKGVAEPVVVRDECRGEVCEAIVVPYEVTPHGVEGCAAAASDIATEIL